MLDDQKQLEILKERLQSVETYYKEIVAKSHESQIATIKDQIAKLEEKLASNS